jgi:hypothetical protein
MKLKVIDPPRAFTVGHSRIKLQDCAHITLNPDEQVTFLTESGTEYDVARKSWGYYATPSINNRLMSFGLRAVLVKGEDGKFFLHLVEKGKEEEYTHYRKAERLAVVCWIDSHEALSRLERKLSRD